MKKAVIRIFSMVTVMVTMLSIFSSCLADVDPIICAGGSFMYARDTKNNWYVWGDNQFGQLGRGNKKQKNEVYSFMTKNTELDPTLIRNVYTGCDYSYFLMENGDMYFVGNGSNAFMYDTQITHKKMDFDDKTIVTMACGFGHNLALNENGEVWAWGNNSYGQVGNGNRKSPVRKAVKIEELSNIVAIAAGGKFSLALDADGVLWGWGDNRNKEIADTKDQYFTKPVKIDTGDLKIKMIDAGGCYSAVVDENGDLYMWGVNDNCQCSFLDKKKADVTKPTKVDLPLPVTYLASYSSQTYVILSDGSLWSWGNNSYGQLGQGFRSASGVGVPMAKIVDSGVIAVTGGSLFMVAMLESGELISTGINKFYQLARTAPYWGDHTPQLNGIDLILE